MEKQSDEFYPDEAPVPMKVQPREREVFIPGTFRDDEVFKPVLPAGTFR